MSNTVIIIIGTAVVVTIGVIAYLALGMNGSSSQDSGGTTYDYNTSIFPPSQSTSEPLPSPDIGQLIAGAHSSPSGYSLVGPGGAKISGSNGTGINQNGTTTSTVNGKNYLLFTKSEQG